MIFSASGSSTNGALAAFMSGRGGVTVARCRAMERRTIGSSVLVSIGYDADDQILEVAFVNGRVYRYEQVPELVHRRLLNAPSPGAFFNAEIRDHYASERVRAAAPPSTSRE
jgi:hypothetical protein